MKVLVTGANGILGSFICQQMLENGYEVLGMVREKSDLRVLQSLCPSIQTVIADVNQLFQLEAACKGVDMVIHCAAKVSFDKKDKDSMMDTNVNGTKNVVNTCLDLGISKLVHVSSIAAIGREKNSGVIDEKTKWVNSELNTAYANSKYLSELEVWRGEAEGLNVLVINPSVILGPSTMERSSGQLYAIARKGKKMFVDGSFNYIDVRDVSKIVYLLIEKNAFGERFILNNNSIDYKTFFGLTAPLLGLREPKIRIKRWQLYLLWPFFSIVSIFTGKRALVSKELIRMTKHKFVYSNKKINKLLKYRYITIETSIAWALEN